MVVQVIRNRRHELGLTAAAKGLIICDKCSSHQSETFYVKRQQFAKEVNCELLGDDRFAGTCTSSTFSTSPAPPPIPGGFGAAGGPNDGFHQYFHHVRKVYMKVGWPMLVFGEWVV